MARFSVVGGGTPGPQGPSGIQGIQGSLGLQGIQGDTGTQGIQGNAGENGEVPVAIRWSPVFSATGLTFTGSGATYPTYNSYYVKNGQMVTFNIECDMTTVTNFGTGQFKLQLPAMPLDGFANHFSAWCWVDPSQPADELNGHIQMVADHLPANQTLDLHWLKETTASPKPLIESLFSQGNPVTLTTSSRLYVNGSYISAS